jgi:hypothetical protein
MDLVNQDLQVREQLKIAYVKTKQFSSESQQYLTAEPNIIKEDLTKIIEDEQKSKWSIGYFAQTSILFRRNWVLTSRFQFRKLNCIQALLMSIVFGLFWLRMEYNEKTLRDLIID